MGSVCVKGKSICRIIPQKKYWWLLSSVPGQRQKTDKGQLSFPYSKRLEDMARPFLPFRTSLICS